MGRNLFGTRSVIFIRRTKSATFKFNSDPQKKKTSYARDLITQNSVTISFKHEYETYTDSFLNHIFAFEKDEFHQS